MRRAQDRARSATIKLRALGALKLAREARDENVPAKRADFLIENCSLNIPENTIKIWEWVGQYFVRKEFSKYSFERNL